MIESDQRQNDIVLIKSLDALIATVEQNTKTASEVSEAVKELSTCVMDLTQSEKVRIEKDKYQGEKNDKFEGHIEKYTPSLDRLVNWHQALDKAKVPLIVSLIVLAGTALGINWKG